jgi:hypothetical protein
VSTDTERGICPPPGLYPDTNWDTYASWNAISNSRLKPAIKSMRHFLQQTPVEETEQMRLGTLIHTGKLEPLALAERYVVMPRFEDRIRKPDGGYFDKPKATAAYRAMVAEFEEEQAKLGKIIVEQEHFERMKAVVRSLDSNEVAREVLNQLGQVEISIAWLDALTKLHCKGRIDKLTESGLVVDLKTTEDITEFPKRFANLAYYRQMAFYCDGVQMVTGREYEPWIVVVETTAPYSVQAARVSEDALEYGRDEYRRLLRQIAECEESGEWPGPENPAEWGLPAWIEKGRSSKVTFHGKVLL